VQLAALKVPVPLLAKVTVPVGVIAVPGDVSVTIAVHVVTLLTTTVAGAQLTAVVVVLGVTVIEPDPVLVA